MRIGFSPCPNDTFFLAALMLGKVEAKVRLLPVIEDVEALNLRAFKGELEVTKLSFHAFCHLLGRYLLLPIGAALGRGVGPLWVAKEGFFFSNLKDQEVAVPGLYTTATLLLKLYFPEARLRPMRFDQIMPAISRDEVASGVIIHEGRFVYPRYGLGLVVDLGRWWEEVTGLPIPLGGFFIRSDQAQMAPQVVESLRDSLFFARENPRQVWEYIKAYAQEMEDDIIRRHIETYVNEFTEDLGPEGNSAVETLVDLARRQGIIKNFPSRFKV